ncbi:hypothetical protein H4R20_003892 [Coemansia guatemalensis]|uniref:Uncharacterized protein n=1 Tax=Coemansia guatemalensis TaxID=2761395 RepID=A0A9W8HUD7_9FUNG|nr:hypothetical protein H4R20_003892 [Coemansia guatemalensis]
MNSEHVVAVGAGLLVVAPGPLLAMPTLIDSADGVGVTMWMIGGSGDRASLEHMRVVTIARLDRTDMGARIRKMSQGPAIVAVTTWMLRGTIQDTISAINRLAMLTDVSLDRVAGIAAMVSNI